MRRDLFRKALVFGIILVFVTISILPSVTSNSYIKERSINPVSTKDSQTNSYSSVSTINPISVEDILFTLKILLEMIYCQYVR